MPFPPKKPDEEKKPAAPAPTPAAPAPADKPAPTPAAPPAPAPDAPAPAADKPAPQSSAAPKAKGGNSAPETPGQGEPDVKPHPEPGAKKEPEADKQALPKEADEAQAKEHPKGLPSVAMMTKAEAEAADKDPMNNPHIQRLAQLVQGLAQIVQQQQAKLGALTLPGQTSQVAAQQQQGQNPGMPGAKPPMGAMPGGKPGMPGAKPGMLPKPGMPTPGQPGVAGQGMRPGVTPTTAGAALSLEQISSIMSIVAAVKAGNISRQGASMLIARGFGMDEKSALALVSPDAAAGGMSPAPMEAPTDELQALNPEEEIEGEQEPDPEDPEEGLEGEEEEPTKKKPLAKKPIVFEQEGPFNQDAAEDVMVIDTALERLQAKRHDVASRVEALTYALQVARSDDWNEEDHPRDESGKFSSGGGGGGGGKDAKTGGPSIPHVTVDPHWKSVKPAAEPGKERIAAPHKVFERDARIAEAQGNRPKAERLRKLAEAVKGERDAVRARIREEIKNAAKNGAPKAHPQTPPQGKDEYFKTNAHPDNIARLKTPEVKEVKYLGGGANDTQKLKLADGSQAVWKPAGGERDGLRTNVPVGTYYLREAAASNLARVIGVQDLVPAVVAFHGPHNPGLQDRFGVKNEHGPFGPPKSIEDHAKGNGEDHTVTDARDTGVVGSLHAYAPGIPLNNMWDEPDFNRDAVERARVFDYITGNSDRHAGNMLVNSRDNDHYPVLIDNGLAFNTRDLPDRAISPPSTLKWHGLLDSTREMIKNINPREVAKTLKHSGLDRASAKLALQRLHHIKADPDFLDSRGSRYDAPFLYDWDDRSKKAIISAAQAKYADVAEKDISAYDGIGK